MQATQATQRVAMQNGPRVKKARAAKAPKRDQVAASEVTPPPATRTSTSKQRGCVDVGRALVLLLVVGAFVFLVVLAGGCSAGTPRVSIGSDGVCLTQDAPPAAPAPSPAPQSKAGAETTVRILVQPVPAAAPEPAAFRLTSPAPGNACACCDPR